METVANIVPLLQSGCAQPYVAVSVENHDHEINLALIINELTDWLTVTGVKIAGPLFYRYHTTSCSIAHPHSIEIGYPVTTEVQGNQRILTGYIPQGTFTTLTHCGQPGALQYTFEALQCWASEQDIEWLYKHHNGVQVLAGCFEFYLTNPADVEDINQCRTALAVLIAQ